MKKKVYKIFSFVLSSLIILSSFSVPVNATAGALASSILQTIGYTALGTSTATIVGHLLDSWLGTDKRYYDCQGTDSNMNYYANSSNFGTISNSGADNENCWNTYSTNITDKRTYSLVKNVDNSVSVYCPVTNTYQTTNNITYNQQYDTYYIQNNEYNYYVTNNYTYVSYYVINNSTNEESYYEIYYELPDGRNSYDLRAYEVWGEYFVYDVVGYDSIKEDDGKTLFLFHFDNDTKDSSYWKVNDFPAFNGIYKTSKYDNGLYFKSTSKYYETAYSYVLPSSFNPSNYTLEFTISSQDLMANYIESFNDDGSENCYHIDFYTSKGSFRFDPKLRDGGSRTIVIQSINGEPSVYINGSPVSVESRRASSSGHATIEITSSSILFRSYILVCNRYKNASGSWIWKTEYFDYVLDELRLSNCALYSDETISVPSQPFDTNQVLCTPVYFHEGMIAIKGTYKVSDYRVGGVRPTYPTDGFVYIYLEDGICRDIQQFQKDGWYSVTGVIRKKGKWMNLKGYDLSVLSFDDTDNDSSNSGNNGSVSDNDTSSGDSGVSGGSSGGGLGNFLKGLGSIGDALLSILGKLLEYVGKAFELITGLIDDVLTIIPENMTNLISALFPFIPEEWVSCITLSLVLGVVGIIIGLFKK